MNRESEKEGTYKRKTGNMQSERNKEEREGSIKKIEAY